MNKQPSNLLLFFFLLFLRINTLGRFNQRAFFYVNFSVKFREYYLFYTENLVSSKPWSFGRLFYDINIWLMSQIIWIIRANILSFRRNFKWFRLKFVVVFFNLKFPIKKFRSKISSSKFSIENFYSKLSDRTISVSNNLEQYN